MMMMVEKKIGRATSAAISPIDFSCNTSRGLSSRFLRMVSIMTIAPSTIIPKSIAPNDSRFAGIFVKCIKINAISNAIGIVIATNNAPFQLPRKIIRTMITNVIPSSNVWETVFSVVVTRLVLSRNARILTPSGKRFSFRSSTAS